MCARPGAAPCRRVRVQAEPGGQAYSHGQEVSVAAEGRWAQAGAERHRVDESWCVRVSVRAPVCGVKRRRNHSAAGLCQAGSRPKTNGQAVKPEA